MSDAPLAAARFIGQRIARKEDRRLLTGRGLYTDDVVVPGMLECAFVRSPVASARISRIEREAAEALPGVHAVLTFEDLKRRPTNLASVLSFPGTLNPTPTVLADGRVKYVGDPVAIVVADNRYIAEDAAALVDVGYEIETPVVTCADAKAGPLVHPELNSNLGHRNATPENPELETAFAEAAHVVVGRIRHQRQNHAPMEGRAIVVHPQGAGELTVYATCQSPHMSAGLIAQVFQIPGQHVRVVAKDVGGSFGQKGSPRREEYAVIASALLLNRPIKWCEDRLENLTSACQAREQEITLGLAFDAESRLQACKADYECNLGTFPAWVDANTGAMMIMPGPYKLSRYGFDARAYFTNTCGWGPYRGPWMIETLAREVMMDVAARQIGIDPIELRRRNLIRREDQPYTMVTGRVLDRVTPYETFELALAKIDVPAFRAEQAAARAQGRYLGLGVAVYIEPTTNEAGGLLATEAVHIRVEPNGKVLVTSGTHSQGQGTETTIAQIVADTLGVDVDDVAVFQDDSSRGGYGGGAGASRQAVAGGGAALGAAAKLRDKIRRIAAHLLNAAPDDVEIERGRIAIRGVGDVGSTVKKIAQTAYFNPDRLPPGMEPGLESQYRHRTPPVVFANAAHACIVEVDPETGLTKILRWVAAEDCGVVINPSIVEGQIAGGLAQGIGGVLLEHAGYDEAGNPTAVTFKDYLLPTIHDVPDFEYGHIATPSDTLGGYKGVGEGGAIIGPPTLVNAINDALLPFGVQILDLPLSPERILDAIDASRAESGDIRPLGRQTGRVA